MTPAPLYSLEGTFTNVIGLFIGFAGIVFFIMFIIGGFNYLTAGGESGKVEGARKTLTYAIAGLVFIALSYLLLKAIAQFTGVNQILDFKIYQP